MADNKMEIKYLSAISSPEDFKAIPNEAMSEVADELRHELVRVVSANGGHLASNLGVVELTMAIHRVFNTPHDHVIFDVGHQCYVHKMLTGRYDKMDSIRLSGGISGFMKREESEHDCFGAGHSSTSLSAALGFATADKLSGSDAYTIAIVGDGAYTGGMIHEALNNCRKDLRLIIIMNENEMSISRNIGRFATNLSKLRASSGYFKTKKRTSSFLKKLPLVGNALFKAVRAIKIFFKNALYGSNYFESMGLTYLGPIDGNNYEAVENLLMQAKNLNESVIVHLKTKKGKGYEPAENAPADFHSMAPVNKVNEGKKSFSQIFGETLCGLGETDGKICAITAAMSDGTGLCAYQKKFPDRFFDVGIAEEHALTFAAGLAANGMKPCAAIYSTFLQRGYDNIIHDIALQKMPVVIGIDRAGLNPKDGATHHGIFDVAFLSHIPGVQIYTPVTEKGLAASVRAAFASGLPCAVRYPSGYENSTIAEHFYKDDSFESIGVKCDYGKGEKKTVIIVTHGRIATEAIKAEELLAEKKISVGIILLEMLKPYGKTAELIKEILPEGVKAVIFLEEEIRAGGMGMNLCDVMNDFLEEKNIKHEIIATNDSFVPYTNKGQSIFNAAGIDSENICRSINKLLKSS